MWGRSSSPPPPTSADANGAWILMPAGSSPRHASRKFRSAAPPPRERGANRTATTSERAAPFRYKSPTRAQKSPHAKTDPENRRGTRRLRRAAPTRPRPSSRRTPRRARPPPRRSGRRASCHRPSPTGRRTPRGRRRCPGGGEREFDVPRPERAPTAAAAAATRSNAAANVSARPSGPVRGATVASVPHGARASGARPSPSDDASRVRAHV